MAKFIQNPSYYVSQLSKVSTPQLKVFILGVEGTRKVAYTVLTDLNVLQTEVRNYMCSKYDLVHVSVKDQIARWRRVTHRISQEPLTPSEVVAALANSWDARPYLTKFVSEATNRDHPTGYILEFDDPSIISPANISAILGNKKLVPDLILTLTISQEVAISRVFKKPSIDSIRVQVPEEEEQPSMERIEELRENSYKETIEDIYADIKEK